MSTFQKINSRLTLAGLGLFLAAATSAQATEPFQTEFSSFNGSMSLAIPDGDLFGVVDVRQVTTDFTAIGSLQVTLNLASEYNGDLFVYLRHGSGFSVLLNRVGRSADNPAGYDDSGFNVTFSVSGAQGDIHQSRSWMTLEEGSPLTGTWAPDGRQTDPASVLDTDPSTAGFGSFEGINPNGTWTLFLADLQPGGVSQLNGWGLQVEAQAVPEPSSWAMLALGFLGLAACCRFRKNDRVS